CARRAAPKGEYKLSRADLAAVGVEGVEGCLAIWFPGNDLDAEEGRWLDSLFSKRLWIGVELLAAADDRERFDRLEQLALMLDLPRVACGDVHMHVRGRRALQDTVTAIRLRKTVTDAVPWLFPNGERHLRSLASLSRLYPEALLQQSCVIADRCQFSLDELRYEYPRELVPDNETPTRYLRRLTREGMQQRWPDGVSDKVDALIEHELELIAELRYEQYFLTVHEIVQFARERGILCQGRGSAANSAVCFALGITEVDPARMSMLFERFISRERNEPPDIDVDFEHERREEVIQHIYSKYGRERAAITATVISYRARSAVRDVGKALGLDALQVDRMARAMGWWEADVSDERLRDAGFDPASPVIHQVRTLARILMGFPRHLSQHVGGFVISRGPLAQLVPVENASMPERTVIQWDKDDLDALGLLKVDVLGLGMLSAIRRSFNLLESFHGHKLSLATVPAEDPVVYDMICKGETMGVFQIESRAQMAMLPRLRPRSYYDLVIEVAIIRPGPIQGDMEHPYLRRRNGEEAVSFPSPDVREVLERTLGVPIFQEQVMHLAMVAAGFSAGEADQLRRAMAAWKRRGGLGPFEDRLISGMLERGYSKQFAQQIFHQIEGFGEYGFPESHAASFALLVYVSAWLKCHEPAVFACALINSQPMGFYAPSQLIQDAQGQGVAVRPVDVLSSAWDCTLERGDEDEPIIRLGLRLVKGLSANAAERLSQARRDQAFLNVQDLATRARLDRGDLGALAAAGALQCLTGNRHRARWDVAGVEAPLPLMPQIEIREGMPLLRQPTEGENVIADYQSTGLTLGRHPMALLRDDLSDQGNSTAANLWDLPDGATVSTSGLVISRQRPGTAKGVTFVTLEDETGHVNLIVWERLAERQRKVLLGSRLLGVRGQLQRQGDVLHVVARQLEDHSGLLSTLPAASRDFR
ncbi:MAG: error-prone DNA polymerase, partial [Gammaproteobacteria bacterium]|nr:error-prone DNA polymerase [Gammaproteobacteria bacterium]